MNCSVFGLLSVRTVLTVRSVRCSDFSDSRTPTVRSSVDTADDNLYSEPLVNPVNIERRGHIMLIMLNRPKDRNAVNQFMAEELYVAFKALESDKSIKAGIICSSGDSFCSGYD